MHRGGLIVALVMVVVVVVQHTEAVPCCGHQQRPEVSVAGSLAIAGVRAGVIWPGFTIEFYSCSSFSIFCYTDSCCWELRFIS